MPLHRGTLALILSACMWGVALVIRSHFVPQPALSNNKIHLKVDFGLLHHRRMTPYPLSQITIGHWNAREDAHGMPLRK